jgi:UDP-2-acetamido-3-amino-2,3-dideoxy-glucuronate N-acetyltransferase
MPDSPTPSNSCIHPAALVETQQIGKDTHVGAFTYIQPGATIGTMCEISGQVLIESEVHIGNRVRIQGGVQISTGVRIEDAVFIGPHALLLNDNSGAARKLKAEPTSRTVIREGAIIGAQALLLPGVIIGRKAVVEAAAVVTHDVPPNAIVTGNPARIVGYVDLPYEKPPVAVLTQPFSPDEVQARKRTRVRGVWLHRMPVITDLRGNLSVGEFGKDLPFEPKRYFVVFDVSSREVRGEHAHRTLHQFLVCLKGECALVVDDGVTREELRLDNPSIGVHVEPMVWGIQYKFSSDALLLVLASDKYDPDDYIRNYDEFERLVALPR